MVLLYTSPGCASCRKAKQWLKDNNIEFVEKNIFTTLLNKEEIKYILSRCENGTEDIISVSSKAFMALKKDINDLSLNELVELIQKNPSILKRPILISKQNLVVGYDSDEITTMIPSELRNIISNACTGECPSFELCGNVSKEISVRP